MNAIIIVNGEDVTSSCILSATRIAYDTSKRITTASITILGQALNAVAAVYDSAYYDTDKYSLSLKELYEVQIFDGRDGVTKLFDGFIFAMTMQQTDAPGVSLFYQCDLSDYAVFLDRSVCWDISFPLTLPNSDQGIITALLTRFCPRIHLTDIALIVPQIQSFDWATKTCRQILDDLTTLSMGDWRVDFDGGLHYKLASAAPAAPFGLSTSPDLATTFPVKVNGYKHDFTNPVNRAYIRGGSDQSGGATVLANYADPVSIQQYGEYATGIVDTQVATGWDAALKAKSIVLANAYPIETGNFTIWKDGLQCGMQVHIHEDNIGIDGNYTIRALTLQWETQDLVRYEAQFGAAQPDLETILRLLNQRTLWATSNKQAAAPGPPAPGSVTDASIASGGLSAQSIGSVNAGVIQGKIVANQIQTINANQIFGTLTADQIYSVNAGSIVGSIEATQIHTVNAVAIQGSIAANQIGAVNATTIQGVIVSQQLADQIIDHISKLANVLRPIQMVHTGGVVLPSPDFPPNSFYYWIEGHHFYQITPDGLNIVQNDNPQGTLQSFYWIGAINANQIIGLILAAQIDTITAGQITGQIQANQIGAVNASVIAGKVVASQIQSVDVTTIQGLIQSGQIQNINAGQISGTIQGNQIANINANTINIGNFQVGGVNMAGSLYVYDNANNVIGEIGNLGATGGSYGGWFKVFGAGGTAYSNAPIYTDLAGNLFIRSPNLTNATLNNSSINNPTFNVGSGSATISTSPTTFDPTYSALALKNTQAPDMTSFVSRGLIIYYNNTKVGAFVRDPGGGFASLEFINGGGYVLISGNTGQVRADGGFTTAGHVGSTASYTLALAAGGSVTLQFRGGILAP